MTQTQTTTGRPDRVMAIGVPTQSVRIALQRRPRPMYRGFDCGNLPAPPSPEARATLRHDGQALIEFAGQRYVLTAEIPSWGDWATDGDFDPTGGLWTQIDGAMVWTHLRVEGGGVALPHMVTT